MGIFLLPFYVIMFLLKRPKLLAVVVVAFILFVIFDPLHLATGTSP